MTFVTKLLRGDEEELKGYLTEPSVMRYTQKIQNPTQRPPSGRNPSASKAPSSKQSTTYSTTYKPQSKMFKALASSNGFAKENNNKNK